MKKFHYSWVICGSCVLLMFCTIGLISSAFSVYMPFITDFGKMTKTESSVLFTIRNLFSFFAVWMINRFYQRTGIRFGMFAAIAIGTIACLFFSMAKGFPGYGMAFAILGLSHGFGGMYPVSILIHRWFHSHQGLALGICAAGSGIAAIIVPPLITLLIEATSLQTTFRLQAAFVGLTALTVFCVVRSAPEELGMTPLIDQKAACKETHQHIVRTATVGKASMTCIIISIFLLGVTCNGALINYPMLYTTEGVDPLAVSFLVSLCGISQTVGKCIYGQVSDWLGARKAGSISYIVLVIGVGLACLAGVCGYPVALCAMLLSGLGFPLYTVGLSVYARDISSEKDYPMVLKYMQVTIILGGLIISVVPGILCDITGSYVPAYILFAVSAALAMMLAQLSYHFQATEERC